jgi:hypothetical protein
MPSIYLGLDLGQANDYSALAVLEEPIWLPGHGWISGSALNPEQRLHFNQGLWYHWKQQAPTLPPLWLRQLHRYDLRTPYPTVVDNVIQRLGGKDARRSDAVLVVDGTGVGAPVVDMFRYADLPCDMYPVIITGGVKVERNHVPKRDLIGAAQVLWQTRRLEVAEHAPLVKTWLVEMENYAFKQSESGHLSYNARGDSQHDDLVLAVALACWYRGSVNRGEQQWQPQATQKLSA